MNYRAYPIGIHIGENSVKTLRGIVQNDNANLFQIQLYDGSAAYDFTGYTYINAVLLKPDGSYVTDIWGSDDSTSAEDSHTHLAIQSIDPANGRINLEVGGLATSMIGMNRLALEIYAGEKRLTTARINYYVVETTDNVDVSILQEDEDWIGLQALIASCASAMEEEQKRMNQEILRQDAEAKRRTETQARLDDFDEKLDTLTRMVENAQASARLAEQWASLAHAVSVEDIPGGLATGDELEEVRAMMTPLDCGTFTGAESVTGLLLMRGLAADLPELRVGEIGWCTDTGKLYIGSSAGNVLVNPDQPTLWVASDEEPADTSLLWIDTSESNTLKFYTANGWTATSSVAVFG